MSWMFPETGWVFAPPQLATGEWDAQCEIAVRSAGGDCVHGHKQG